MSYTDTNIESQYNPNECMKAGKCWREREKIARERGKNERNSILLEFHIGKMFLNTIEMSCTDTNIESQNNLNDCIRSWEILKKKIL